MPTGLGFTVPIAGQASVVAAAPHEAVPNALIHDLVSLTRGSPIEMPALEPEAIVVRRRTFSSASVAQLRCCRVDIPDSTAPVPLVEDASGLDLKQEVAAIRGEVALVRAAARLPRLHYLWVSGVRSDAATEIGEWQHLRKIVVHDLRTSDLTAWSKLTKLEALSIVGSSKLKSLAGLEGLRGLRELVLLDCTNFSDVEPLRSLTALETLCLEGGFSKSLGIASLSPLASLTALVELRLASLRVDDESLRPLHSLRRLRSVFIAKTFGKDELRSLAKALPRAQGMFLDEYRA